jgi:site-specific recombinase XerD
VPADLITAFAHYLEVEARLSPRTVREYSADVRQFRRWLDAAHPQTPWAEVAPAHLRASWPRAGSARTGRPGCSRPYTSSSGTS